MKLSVSTVAVMAVIALSACTAKKEVTTPAASAEHTTTVTPVTTPTKSALDIIGQWAVVNVNGTQVTAPEDDYPYITFEEGEAGGNNVNLIAYNGCNYANGSFAVNGNTLTRTGEIAVTMKFCADAKFEIPITTALNSIASYQIDNVNNEYLMTLKDAAGNALMTLRKQNLAFLEGSWRVKELNGAKVDGEHAPELVIDLVNGKIHGNAGCNVVNGNIVEDFGRAGGLSFANLFTTMMACPYLDTERAFLVALEQVTSCTPDNGYNTAIFKDAQGTPIIVMERIKLG